MVALEAILLLLAIVGLVAAGGLFYLANGKRRALDKALAEAEARAAELVAKAEADAQNQHKALILEARDEALRLKLDAERELKELQLEAARRESRALQKEETLDA